MRSSLTPSIAAVVLLAVAHPSPSTAGLIGYWSFDGCTTTASSGTAGDLTAGGGVSCVTGSFGQAWQLDGFTGNLMGSSTPVLTPGARAWSVAAWVNASTNVGLELVASWYRCGANPGCQSIDSAEYLLAVYGDHPYWDVRDDAGNEHILDVTTAPMLDGKWHLLVGTMNPASGNYSLYLDGALAMTGNGPFATLTDGGVGIPLSIGRLYRTGWGSPGYYFDGAIDEVRIYDQELSAAAVAALYGNTTGVHGGAQANLELAIVGAVPNPARSGRLAVSFTLPSSDPARLTLFDLAGRMVALQPVGVLGAGPHQVELAVGRHLAPGLYVVQLRQGERVLSRPVSVLE